MGDPFMIWDLIKLRTDENGVGMPENTHAVNHLDSEAHGFRTVKNALPLLGVFLCLSVGGTAMATDFTLGSVAMELSGKAELSGVIPFTTDSTTEAASARIALDYKAYLSSSAEFTACFEGVYDGSVNDPSWSAPFTTWNRVFPDQNPYVDLDEAYLSLYLGSLDIRTGIQKYSWGTLDEINPTDNLNPKDFRHPFGLSILEQKIGVPSVDVTYYPSFDDLSIKGIWIPFWVSYRMADIGERWYPPLFTAPTSLEVDIPWIPIPLPPITIRQTNAEIDRPPTNLSHSAFAFKLARTVAGMDLSLSYYNGYDPKPVMAAGGTALAEVGLVPYDPHIAYDLTVYPFHRRIQVFGADMAMAWDAFTFRAETAYFKGRYINVSLKSLDEIVASIPIPALSEFDIAPRPGGGLAVAFPFNPKITFQKDVLSIGAGMDYQLGSYLISLQAVLDHIIDFRDEPLVFEEYEVTCSLGVHATFFNDTVAVEGGVGVNPMQELVIIKANADYLYSEKVTLGLSFLILEGDPKTPFGQFSMNDQLLLRAVYHF